MIGFKVKKLHSTGQYYRLREEPKLYTTEEVFLNANGLLNFSYSWYAQIWLFYNSFPFFGLWWTYNLMYHIQLNVSQNNLLFQGQK